MRLLRELPIDELESFQEFVVATIEADMPEKGDRLRLGDLAYEVLEVFRWYESYSETLDYKEVAISLRVRRDDRAETSGVRELRPYGPGSLSSSAEAKPPDEDLK
jgi:hypothetical protein